MYGIRDMKIYYDQYNLLDMDNALIRTVWYSVYLTTRSHPIKTLPCLLGVYNGINLQKYHKSSLFIALEK
jgi:hypothetical protein